MNGEHTLSIYGGGPGSGPNAPCPQCGPSHKLEVKDIVKLKKGDSLYNFKTGNVDKFGPGLKAVVVNVLPKVGDNPQMLKVNILSPGKKHEQDNFRYVKMNDVDLHKLGDRLQVQNVKPVMKSKVLLKFKSKDGADVTWVRPHTDEEKDPETIKSMSQKEHYLKGEFDRLVTLKGIQDRPGYTRYSRIYETSVVPKHAQKGAGATVWVDAYTQKGKIKEVKISEQNYTTYAMKTRGIVVFSYKNAAEAVGMLNTRYGIKTTLARLRGVK